MTTPEKRCPRCEQSKPFGEFYSHKGKKDGLKAWCKTCTAAQQAQMWQEDFSRLRSYQLKYRYGMARGDYEAVLARQGGVCAGCGTGQMQPGEYLQVDHDHACCPDARKKKCCGQCNRGLLCGKCNKLLGLADDDPNLLRRLADYIEQWAASRPPLELFSVEEVSGTAA